MSSPKYHPLMENDIESQAQNHNNYYYNNNNGVANQQQFQPNYNYPHESINKSFKESEVDFQPYEEIRVKILDKKIITEINDNSVKEKYTKQTGEDGQCNGIVQNYFNYGNEDVQQQQDIYVMDPPYAPPPAYEYKPRVRVVAKRTAQPEIRDYEEIMLCKHERHNKHLYISNPQIIVSSLLLIFFFGGLIAMVVGFIIIGLVLSPCEGCDDCNCGCDCKCNICDDCCYFVEKDCYFSIFYFFDICCGQRDLGYAVDSQYYRSNYNRQFEYQQYEQKKSSRNIMSYLYNLVCCSCFNKYSFQDSQPNCLINKVEVYCTNCNSKLQENYTGKKYICPALLYGIIGYAILGASLYLLFKFGLYEDIKNSSDKKI